MIPQEHRKRKSGILITQSDKTHGNRTNRAREAKMHRPILVIFILVFFLSAIVVFAQNTNTPKIPEGMEAVAIGGSAQLIIPKGAKTRKVGAQIIVEGTKEYMARRFEEMEQRLAKMEKDQEDLKKKIQSLEDTIKQTQKNP